MNCVPLPRNTAGGRCDGWVEGRSSSTTTQLSATVPANRPEPKFARYLRRMENIALATPLGFEPVLNALTFNVTDLVKISSPG